MACLTGEQEVAHTDHSVQAALEDFDKFREAIRGPKQRQGREFAPVWMQLKFMQLLPSPLVRPRPNQLPPLQVIPLLLPLPSEALLCRQMCLQVETLATLDMPI